MDWQGKGARFKNCILYSVSQGICMIHEKFLPFHYQRNNTKFAP